MTKRTSRNLHRAALFAAALGLAVSASGTAQAFTFQDADGGSAGGARSGYKDLDIPKTPPSIENDARYNGGKSTLQQGNTTFQFGARPSFNEQYNPSYMFNPYYRDGRW